MKKKFLKVFIFLCIWGFMAPQTTALAKGKYKSKHKWHPPKPEYTVDIRSDKEEYQLGDEVKFTVQVKKRKRAIPVKTFDFEATFPKAGNIVELSKKNRETLEYQPILEEQLSAQTLTVYVYRKEHKKLILHLEKEIEQVERKKAKIEEFIAKNSKCKGRYEHWIKIYESIIRDIYEIIEKLNTPIAQASKTILVEVNADETPPSINISGVLDNEIYNVNVTPLITISDENDFTSEITLNGATYLSGTEIENEGDYVLAVTATDVNDNTASKSIHFYMDKTPPEIVIVSPEAGALVNDPDMTVEYTVDGEVKTKDFTLEEGVNTLTITEEDLVGNSASESLGVTLDTVPPEIIISSPEEGDLVNDPDMTVEYTSDGEAKNKDFILLEGANTLTISEEDLAGNSTSASVGVTLDTVPPEIIISSPEEGALVNDPAITVEYTSDGEVKTKDFILSEGANTLTIIEEDLAGNSAAESVDITLDTIPPEIIITSPEEGALFSDPDLTVEYTSDGEAKTKDFTLEEGTNTLTITEEDLAGNSSTESISVTLDTLPPEDIGVTIVEGSYTNDENVHLSLIAEGALEMMISEDVNFAGASWELYIDTKAMTLSLDDGIKTIYVKYRDEALNESTIVTDSIILDQTPPTVSITQPITGFSTRDETILITGTVSEPCQEAIVNGVTAVCNDEIFTVDSFALNLGNNNFIQAQAVDLAGNVGYSQTISVLQIQGKIVGRVFDAVNGIEIEGVVVTIFNDFDFGVSTLTNVNGEYEFINVSEGQYKIGVFEGDKYHQPQFYDGKANLSEAELFSYRGGGDMSFDFPLEQVNPTFSFKIGEITVSEAPGQGDGDGVIESNEGIKLVVELENLGDEDAFAVSTTLSTTSDLVDAVSYADVDYGDIAIGEIKDNEIEYFEFTINDLIYKKVVNCTLTISAFTYDNFEFVQTKNFVVELEAKKVDRDFDGDGKSDVLLRHASDGTMVVWLMDGVEQAGSGVVASPSLSWQLYGIKDFDADGKADILLRNMSAGTMVVWLMDGVTQVGSGTVASPPLSWQLEGIADFNGDNKADILLRNMSDGTIVVWIMDGVEQIGSGTVASPPLSWQLQGMKDFDGDGKTDILLRNMSDGTMVVWLMDGVEQVGSGVVASPSLSWDLQGMKDFDGDGKTDILLRNMSDGTMVVWLMDGVEQVGSGTVASPSLSWELQGMKDFDGDGKADILLRNMSDGTMVVWLMDGVTQVGSGVVASPSLGWQLEGIRDFNGDGKADILLRNMSDGTIVVWIMDGVEQIDSGVVASPSLSWDLQ